MVQMGNASDDRLLRALAEQLKLPLIQIARFAELSAESGNLKDFSQISNTADRALTVIDSFLLNHERTIQQSLDLSPVSVSSVLQDAAHKLEPLAKQNNCQIEVSLSGKYGPVMAHKKSLEAALMLLGQSMMGVRNTQSGPHRVVFAAHKSSSGLVTGVFDNQPGITTDMLKRGRALFGSARQALPSMSSSSGADVFIAESLLKSMESSLFISKHQTLTGLAAIFNLSNQLKLV